MITKIENWKIPKYLFFLIFTFLIINTITIVNIRGVVDEGGYLWNSRFIPINTYEDDGRLNVYAAIGYRGFHKSYEHLINIGGPYIDVLRKN